MKMFNTLMLAVLILLGLSRPFSADAAQQIQPDALATTSTQLNLRAGPSATAALLHTIPAGAYLSVTSGPHNGDWYATSFAGASGYVNGRFLRQSGNMPRLSEVTATTDITLRAGPATTHPVVGVVPRGMRVTVDAKPQTDGWRKISYGEVAGYARSDAFVRTLGNGGARRIVVDLSDQWLYAYESGEIVLTVPVSTGRDGFNTPRGIHRVQWKAALRTMKGSLNGETWEVPNVPHAMYLTSSGVAMHGAYWHNRFGSGARLSHGCINLPLESAALLYDWVSVGTMVEVRS
jgi:lipoprotein-anchoring transpeptidase ErfK/SrfK